MNEQKAILAAILAAQKKMPMVAKNAENPHFSSQYATLDGIWSAVRNILADAGLVVTNAIEGGEVVTTVAEVKSGETMVSRFPLPNGLAPQQIGSALTYAKRYNLCALLQITTGDDDDGNAAQTAIEAKAKEAKKPSETAPRVQTDYGICPCGKTTTGKRFSDIETATLKTIRKSIGKGGLTDRHAEVIDGILKVREAVQDI